jgi:hypothetical protein
MTDTPQNIQDLQLKIWLSKSPMERLKQMMEDNAALTKFWATARKPQHNSANGKSNSDTSSTGR